jgi:hypothetical protein
MKSIIVFTCCLALASIASAEQNQGKKKKGGKGQQAQQVQQQPQGGKHGNKANRQGVNNAAQLNAGQGNKAARHAQHQMSKTQANTLPAAQKGQGKVNVKHFNISGNNNVQTVKFSSNRRIVGAQNWKGAHYNVFRVYRPQWHNRIWWTGHYPRIVLIGGGWYYWNSGFWYPAWGYDPVHAEYAYDGPIYAYNDLPPDQVVANVQETLQTQGYYHGEVDGMLGPLTRAALADYQRDHGLYTTAAIDQPTLESLGFS